MKQFKEAANVEIAYWEDTLYAWYKPKYSQEEQEITISNGDIIPALNSLAQELFRRRIYPLFQTKEIRDGFFPLNHNEKEYFHARFSELEGIVARKQVEEILKRIERQ